MSMSVLPGEEIWRFQEGSFGSYEVIYGISADAEGNFFLAGKTSGSIDSAVDNAGEHDHAVMKIDTEGDLLWTWQEGATGDESFLAAAATDDGGVVVAGYSNGTIDGVVSEGSSDFLAVKLDADGVEEWRWQEGSDAEDDIRACSRTADGNIVLAGSTRGSWDGVNTGYQSFAAVKLDVSDGSVIWRYQAAATFVSAFATASAARSDGSIVLGGITDGDWDGDLSGIVDICAVALDEDGEELWRWQDGVPYGINVIHDAAALSDGSVVFAGSTEGDYVSTIGHAGGEDFMAVKVFSNGVTDWRWQGGTELDDEVYGVATNIDGTSVVMGGYTRGTWVTEQAGDDDDIDIVGMSFDTDGTLLWTYQAGTDEYEVCYAVAVRPTDGGALLAGYSQGTWDGTANSYAQAAGVLLETGAEEAASTASMAPTPSLTSTSTAYSEGDVPLTTPSPLPAARTTDEPSSSFPTTTTEERTVSTTSTDDDGLYPPSSSSSSGTCGADESFRIVSSALPGIQGCFQITSESFAKGSDGEYYTRDGILDYEKLWVFGYDNESQGVTPYNVQYASENDDQDYYYCYTAESAIDVHPVDATWFCDLGTNEDFSEVTAEEVSFTCGCAGGTPAPAAPTPAPGAIEAPVAASSVSSSSSDSGVPLGAVIGGTLAGVALLAIIGIVVVRRKANQDESFGRSPAAPEAGAPRVTSGPGAVAGAAKGGGGSAGGPLPPPPGYTEPPPAGAGDLPPPPPYTEPPSYSG